MDDANKMLAEMRTLQVELAEVEEQEKLTEERREKLNERRQLLEETWKILWSHPDMTLIQAKMIAHDETANRKRRHYFSWTYDRACEEESRRTRILRWFYIKMGGK